MIVVPGATTVTAAIADVAAAALFDWIPKRSACAFEHGCVVVDKRLVDDRLKYRSEVLNEPSLGFVLER